MTSSHGDGTQAHYDRLAASYDQNWAYSPAYIAWMTRCILDRAATGPGQVVADVGCGTGLYSRQLATTGATVICADPSQAMLDQLPGDPALVPVRASAQDIAGRRVALPAFPVEHGSCRFARGPVGGNAHARTVRRLVRRHEPRAEHDREVPVLRRHERRRSESRDRRYRDDRVQADEACEPRVDCDSRARGRRDPRARARHCRGVRELE